MFEHCANSKNYDNNTAAARKHALNKNDKIIKVILKNSCI